MANSNLFKGNIDGVDLNCGCPQGFAMEKKIGACLLREPDHLVDLVKQISSSILYPLSIKMRFHEDGIHSTIGLVNKLAQVANVKAITIHGRYYWQKGSNLGLCDWEGIKLIKESLEHDISLIGNGDINSFDDISKYKKLSGVDSVMVGYGALCNPTLFQNKNNFSIDSVLSDYLNIAKAHNNSLIDIERHIQWMIKSRVNENQFSISELFKSKNLFDVSNFLSNMKPPIIVKIDNTSNQVDNIKYPLSLDEMNDKQKKINEKRLLKNELKMKKRAHLNSEF